MRQIYISDFTLKKLQSSGKTPLLFREKTSIAGALDEMNVDAIELAPITKVREDTIIYKTIASVVKNAALCVPVGFTKEEAKIAYDSISEAVRPCLQVVLPVSTVQMEYAYHLKEPKMLLKIEELCKAAKELCDNVEFIALDATRASEDFLLSALRTARDAGAVRVTISDDAEEFLPEEFAALVKKVKAEISLPVLVHVSDKFNMATATAVAAILAGADGVKSIAAGSHELSTDDLSKLFIHKGNDLKIATNLDTTKVHTEMKNLSGKVNAISPAETSAVDKKGDIFLEENCSIDQISEATQLLGYSLSEDDLSKVLKGVQRVCRKKSSIGSKEFEAIIAANAMQVPSTYHLESYSVTSSNMTAAMSNVSLLKGNETLLGVATGDGPIDAAFKAIEQCIGYHYELDEFHVQAVTEGKEALGSALVRLRSNGNLYSGNGISTDIVAASIRAYINALNKIVYEEN